MRWRTILKTKINIKTNKWSKKCKL